MIQIPQPGAVEGDYTKAPHLPAAPLSHPGWPTSDDLPASQAPNFESAQGVELSPGTELYRVYGGASHADGYYWALTPPPATQAQWRSGMAVEESWNNGMQLEKAVVGSAGAKAWQGPAAAKPALDIFGAPMPGFMLPGGAIQLNMVALTDLDITPIEAPAWDQQDARTPLGAMATTAKELSATLIAFAHRDGMPQSATTTLIIQGHEINKIAIQLTALEGARSPQSQPIINAVLGSLRGIGRYIQHEVQHVSEPKVAQLRDQLLKLIQELELA